VRGADLCRVHERDRRTDGGPRGFRKGFAVRVTPLSHRLPTRRHLVGDGAAPALTATVTTTPTSRLRHRLAASGGHREGPLAWRPAWTGVAGTAAIGPGSERPPPWRIRTRARDLWPWSSRARQRCTGRVGERMARPPIRTGGPAPL